MALPTEVTAPVRFAFVVTLLAVNAVAVPVMFVPTSAVGVPSAGVTSVELVNSSALVTCFVVPPCTIGRTSVVAAAVALGSDVIAIVAMLVISCVNVKTLPVSHQSVRH